MTSGQRTDAIAAGSAAGARSGDPAARDPKGADAEVTDSGAPASETGDASGQTDSLVDLLDDLRPGDDEADRDSVALGDLVRHLGRRGHAAAIFAPALLALSPAGMIPGMSIATGTVILCMAGQMALSRDGLWLPGRAARVKLPADRLDNAIAWLEPKLGWLDRLFRRRLDGLCRSLAERLLALPVIVLALLMYPLAVVPFGVAMPSAAICLLSLGIIVKDGAVVAAGLAASAAALAGSIWAISGFL